MAKTKGKAEKKDLTLEERSKLQSDLRRFGYLLPTSEEEVEEFDKIFGKTQIMFPDRLNEPRFLSEKAKEPAKLSKPVVVSKKSKSSVTKTADKPKKSDYFKRLVLAAHIANELHAEPTFGHIKFVKVYMLCDKVCRMNLSTAYAKHAAGPLDAKQLHMFDAEFKKKNWFEISTTAYGAYKYKPIGDPNAYEVWYGRYFRNNMDEIARVLDLFRKAPSDFCEIVATLFFVWMEFLDQNKLVNNKSLIAAFYAWHPEKTKFGEDEVEKAIDWMNENRVTPVK